MHFAVDIVVEEYNILNIQLEPIACIYNEIISTVVHSSDISSESVCDKDDY